MVANATFLYVPQKDYFVTRSVFCHGFMRISDNVCKNVRIFFVANLLDCSVVTFVTVNSEIFAGEQGPLHFLFHAELVDTS